MVVSHSVLPCSFSLDNGIYYPRFASDLGVAIKIANQIEWGIMGRNGTAKKINW